MEEPDASGTATATLVAEPANQSQPLGPRPHLVYLAWFVAWFVGLGSMWVGVLETHPYPGPEHADVVVFICMVTAATLVTIVTVLVADRVQGRPSPRASAFVVALAVGFAATVSALAALDEYGVTAGVFWVIGGSVPVLVTGLVFLVGFAIWGDRTMSWLGVWLVLVAATAPWAGPVWVLGAEAIAVSAGFLAAGAWVDSRVRRTRRGRFRPS